MDGRSPWAPLLRAFAGQIARGEWTTYGDLAAAADLPSPRMAAHAAALDPAFPNAHRVLGAGGRIRRRTEPETDRVRRRLEREGVRFEGVRADPDRRVRWIDLRGRLEDADANSRAPVQPPPFGYP